MRLLSANPATLEVSHRQDHESLVTRFKHMAPLPIAPLWTLFELLKWICRSTGAETTARGFAIVFLRWPMTSTKARLFLYKRPRRSSIGQLRKGVISDSALSAP